MKKMILASLLFGTSFSQAQQLQDAIKLTDNEQFYAATRSFRNLIQQQPSLGENYFYMGENYFKSAKLDSAQIAYSKGSEVNATNPINFVGLGKVQWYAGKFDDAKANFTKAMTMSNSKNALVLMKIAECYTQAEKKDLMTAFSLLTNAAKLEPKNAEVFILTGDAFLENNNDGTNAIKNYEKAAELDKSSVKAILRIGQLYGRARNYNLALDYYKKAALIDSSFAPAYREQGELYYMAKQYNVAKAKYKRFLELSSNNLDARTRYASFLFLSKDYATAISEIMEIQKLDTSSNILNRLLAYSYYETADYANGMKKSTLFFNRAPKEQTKILAQDYEYNGKLHIKSNLDSLGIEKLNKALDMDTSKTDLYSEIASSYMKQKKYSQAISNYQKKITIGKPNANDYFGLGRAYYFSKDYVNADTAFAQIIKSNPTLPLGYLWRAKSNTQLDPSNDKGLAKPYYEKFTATVKPEEVEKNKKDLIEAYSYLGFQGMKQKDNAAAKANWQKVLELDAANEKAKKALESLK
jgi:tetratricopeptide (TPR) repeat protein